MAYVNSSETIGPTGISINIGIPAGSAQGQTVVAYLLTGANSVSDTFTSPDMELLGDPQPIGAHAVMTAWGIKELGATPPATVQVNWQSSAFSEAVAGLWSDRDTSDPFDIINLQIGDVVTAPPASEATANNGDDLAYGVFEWQGLSGLETAGFTRVIDDPGDGIHMFIEDAVIAGPVSVQVQQTIDPPVQTYWWTGLIGLKAPSTPPPPAPTTRRSITRYGDSRSWQRWR